MTNYKRQPAYKAGENGKTEKVSPYDDAQTELYTYMHAIHSYDRSQGSHIVLAYSSTAS